VNGAMAPLRPIFKAISRMPEGTAAEVRAKVEARAAAYEVLSRHLGQLLPGGSCGAPPASAATALRGRARRVPPDLAAGGLWGRSAPVGAGLHRCRHQRWQSLRRDLTVRSLRGGVGYGGGGTWRSARRWGRGGGGRRSSAWRRGRPPKFGMAAAAALTRQGQAVNPPTQRTVV
jgi:hypothetical protein